MRRVSVVGNSGSGKTMLAKRIASCLGVPYLELDSVHHQANWQPLDPDRFRALVDEHTAATANRCATSSVWSRKSR